MQKTRMSQKGIKRLSFYSFKEYPDTKASGALAAGPVFFFQDKGLWLCRDVARGGLAAAAACTATVPSTGKSP
ncbi:MAG TPA: hypothetical protein VEA17_22215 [Bordetella sp.]|nr:hypothetical protein [Bordetella sp.]